MSFSPSRFADRRYYGSPQTYDKYMKLNNQNQARRTGSPFSQAVEVSSFNFANYTDGEIGALATQALHTLKNCVKPWMLAVGFIRPHLPFIIPQDMMSPPPSMVAKLGSQDMWGLLEYSNRVAPAMKANTELHLQYSLLELVGYRTRDNMHFLRHMQEQGAIEVIISHLSRDKHHLSIVAPFVID